MRWFACSIAVLCTASVFGCGVEYRNTPSTAPANVVVRQRVAAYQPAASFAHRGQGPTRSGNPYPENSLSAFRAAIAQGTNALEMDSELTADGRLVLMHDDSVDRTTECRGCVSNLTFNEVRNCRLLDGDGNPTAEVPPTLDEVFALEPRDILINVELKVFSGACRTAGHGPIELADTMVAELRQLGVERRTIVQSFDAEALSEMKSLAPDIYTAYLVSGLKARDVNNAVNIQADALQPGGAFPLLVLSSDLIRSALDSGLQVIVWTVDDAESMNKLLDDHVSGIITDDPLLFRSVVASRS
jgi:glycerophosphoryl diester phosphodiesterase